MKLNLTYVHRTLWSFKTLLKSDAREKEPSKSYLLTIIPKNPLTYTQRFFKKIKIKLKFNSIILKLKIVE